MSSKGQKTQFGQINDVKKTGFLHKRIDDSNKYDKWRFCE